MNAMPREDLNPIAPPTAFPAPGVYDNPQIVTLLSAAPGAEIYYTLDGALPTPASTRFDRYRLIPMQEFGQEAPAGPRSFTIRAIAAQGERVSAVSTFAYAIEPRSRDEYISHEVAPGVRMIRDFENDKMYLIVGSERALLIDAGMGSGDLRGVVESFTGGRPLDVAITHAHPDHIAKMGQFQADCDVYMHLADLPMVNRFIERMGYEIDPARIKDLREGFVFDLGDRHLRVFHVPGHSKGCIVLLDEENETLFAGDAIGSNRPTIVDALWMQMSETTIDEYLSIVQVFRSKVAGKVKWIYGGHNDTRLAAEPYLDQLEAAAQRLVDLGVDALVPGPRPSGVWQVVSGDRLADPNWVAINVNRERCLSAHPDKIASLSNLQITGGALNEAFHPAVFHYTASAGSHGAPLEIIPTATASRTAGLKVNGVEVKSGQVLAVKAGLVSIEVQSPDGSVRGTYTVEVV